jgi:hypothetical protein
MYFFGGRAGFEPTTGTAESLRLLPNKIAQQLL